MIAEFIAVLFLGRDLAHRAHLKSSSYSQHVALGDFYESIVEAADSLAEAYQGRHGIIESIPLLDNEFPQEIIESMEAQLKWIEDNRYTAVNKEDSPLQNLIDEIVAVYLRALYKLKNLK